MKSTIDPDTINILGSDRQSNPDSDEIPFSEHKKSKWEKFKSKVSEICEILRPIVEIIVPLIRAVSTLISAVASCRNYRRRNTAWAT